MSEGVCGWRSAWRRRLGNRAHGGDCSSIKTCSIFLGGCGPGNRPVREDFLGFRITVLIPSRSPSD